MFNGKMKAVTFSYDDGVTQDRRLVELFNKYGLKATFNVNSGLFSQRNKLVREGVEVSHDKVSADEIKSLYAGHEVAAHAVHHEILTDLSDDEIVAAVENDRMELSRLVGYDVCGFAYPCGCFDERVISVLKSRTGVKYARTADHSHSFALCENPYDYTGTVYHIMEGNTLFELAESFLMLKPETPQLFYIWGHAYEFDIANTWDRFEEFCKMISGKDDIFYGTNREVLL